MPLVEKLSLRWPKACLKTQQWHQIWRFKNYFRLHQSGDKMKIITMYMRKLHLNAPYFSRACAEVCPWDFRVVRLTRYHYSTVKEKNHFLKAVKHSVAKNLDRIWFGPVRSYTPPKRHKEILQDHVSHIKQGKGLRNLLPNKSVPSSNAFLIFGSKMLASALALSCQNRVESREWLLKFSSNVRFLDVLSLHVYSQTPQMEIPPSHNFFSITGFFFHKRGMYFY